MDGNIGNPTCTSSEVEYFTNQLQFADQFDRNPVDWFETLGNSTCESLKIAFQLDTSGLNTRDKIGRTILHEAAAKGFCDKIQLLTSLLNFDLNAQDKRGMTALHEAVQNDQLEAIHTLMQIGVDVSLCNNNGLPALFYAVDLNRISSLRTLLTYNSIIDINSCKDSNGSTALHFAASKNLVDCAKILIESKADYQVQNKAGWRPVEVAAHAAATDVLRLLCEQVAKDAGDLEEFMSVCDFEGNLVLHAAVNSGCVETVRTCLCNGALMDTMQEKQSCTAVHFAAMRGELQIVQAMFTAQPDRVHTVLSLKDRNGMTLLHNAVLFDKDAMALFLLDQGAPLEATDENGRTPLLLATFKKSCNCIKVLLDRGANALHVEKSGRNLLHLAMLNGVKLNNVLKDIPHMTMQKLIGKKDNFGFSPLDYASIEGDFPAVHDLLNHDAHLEIYAGKRQTALHLAARLGHLNTCKMLLASSFGKQILNLADYNGWTALHLTARYGHTKLTELLLENGASYHRDSGGNSELHLASVGGHVKTIKLLLRYNPHFINLQCKEGNTGLHLASLHGHEKAAEFLLSQQAEIKLNFNGCTFFDLAIKNRRSEVCEMAMKHNRWREILSIKSLTYPSQIFGLIEELPEVCLQVLERCVTTNKKSCHSKQLAVTYDFTFLELDRPAERNEVYEPIDSNSSRIFETRNHGVMENEDKFSQMRKKPFPVVNHMVKFNRTDLLVTPLCRAYLQMKWERVAKRLTLIILVFQIFLALLLTVTIWNVRPMIQCFLLVEARCEAWTNETCVAWYMQNDLCIMSLSVKICVILKSVTTVIQILQLFYLLPTIVADREARGNLSDLSAILFVTGVICVSCFVFPIYFTDKWIIKHWFQWYTLIIATILQFFQLLLMTRNRINIGTYVVLFLEVLKTLLKCYGTFILPIFGFALAFTVLFQVEVQSPLEYETFIGNLAHANPLISLIRCITMTTGELKLQETLLGALTDPELRKGLPFPETAALLFIAFTILVSIALFNLSVGLAIGDAERILRNAEFKRVSCLIVFYSMLENILIKFITCKGMRPVSITDHPNAGGPQTSWWHHISNKNGKAVNRASETTNQLHFRQSIMKLVQKQKQRTSHISIVLERQGELIKLISDHLKVDRSVVLDCGEETESSDLKNTVITANIRH